MWLIFRNLFPVMHYLLNIWLKNIAQTDLYVLDVAPGTWYLSKRLFPDALLYDFNLYGQIFYHYFDCPDIQKHKFCNFADDGDTDISKSNYGSSDISLIFELDDIFT
jgi:hypothetical protein